MKTLVKICGITNIGDALAASEAAADFLGFNFHPTSLRFVTIDSAKQIISTLRDRQTCPILVGVFVNESAATVARVMSYCRLDLAQLSGNEPPALVGDPASAIYGRCYKSLRPSSLAEAEADVEWYVPPEPMTGQPTLMLDLHHPTLHGGTSQTENWNMATKVASSTEGLMLAGGLNPANVAQAVREVRPFAVDVGGGVESSPGEKDRDLVRAFVTAAKSALVLQH